MKQWHTLKQLRDQSHYHFQNLLHLLEDLKKTKKNQQLLGQGHTTHKTKPQDQVLITATVKVLIDDKQRWTK